MRFHVLTLFPQMIEQGLSESITGRALKQNIISLNTVNIRDLRTISTIRLMITHMVAVRGCLCRQSRCIRLCAVW